ncbi:sensor histidine kinase [Nonomuraea sp. SBT364]|uniref:sensor histidine kinase n=1 Tax=Nonomuraea sp. SBT364 TaxID=1580530 RepID=UPI00069CF5BE|nr:nitrate- and nitrite sensing domain-containing protein [Nonomuraea sp. SBT364]
MRSRLVALILIPTVVGVLLAGLQLANAIDTSAEYRRLTQVSELVQRVGALSHELGKERTLTAWYLADGRRAGRLAQLRTQRGTVDAALKKVVDASGAIDASHSARVRGQVEEIRRWLNGLDGLRKAMVGESTPPRATISTLSTLIEVLGALQDDLSEGVTDDALQGDVAALAALQRVKEEVSRQQGILIVALEQRSLDNDDLSDFLGSWNRQQDELARFEQEAGQQDLRAYRQNVRGQQIDRADAMRQRALAQLREYDTIQDLDITTASPRQDINLWYNSTLLTTNAMRKVEDGLATRVVTQTRELSDSEQRNAIISGATILVLLLLVLVITTRVAGSLVRPLRRLRAEALQVATTRLPETVRVLRESGDAAEVPEVPSVGVNTRDEIGEVARAFDEVHREAIRLAGDEAKLRANVNSMFVNLSRRSQTLVERQLQLIEGLEQGEEDENRLANLFRLDHLATRMRRNSENLLVLAGQEAARKWSEPVPLVDVARASLSEVEGYERVQIQIPSSTQVAGPAVTDAVHLLAELIENAISFSPRESKVQVTSSAAEGGVLVTINDLGIGMSPEELAEANWRLANPPVVDVAVSRRMGLFVVGRLALRHGIRVQLQMRERNGLTALVLLPDMLLVGNQPPGVPQPRSQYDAFTSFDPGMIDSGQATAASNGTGVYAAPPTFDTTDVRGARDVPVDTEWPGSLPAPGGEGWPSFGEQPPQEPRQEQPWPSFGEQPPQVPAQQQEEPRWPSFATEPPPMKEEPRWSSFAEEPPAAKEEQRWPSFAEEPPPLQQEEPRWPSFATEPPAMKEEPKPQEETRWTSFADPLPRRDESLPRRDALGDEPRRDPFGEDLPRRDGFGEDLPRRDAFGEDLPRRDGFGEDLPRRDGFGEDLPRRDGLGEDLPRRDAFGAEPGRSAFGADERPWPSFAESSKSEPYAQNGDSGYNPFGPGEYSSQDLTGPLPVVRSSPMEEQSEEFLPIFSSVGSDWFRRPDPEPAEPAGLAEPETPAAAPRAAEPAAPPASPAPTGRSALPQRRPGQSGAGASWSSPADSGWQAAEAAAKPAQSGTTASGLPRRVPKANLVPGTASLAEPPVTSPAPQISPERLRSRLSSFQQGVRQGRAFTRGDENEEEK